VRTSIMAYAYPAWHTSPTKEQSCQKIIQKRAIKIIFDSNCNDYDNFYLAYKPDTVGKLVE